MIEVALRHRIRYVRYMASYFAFGSNICVPHFRGYLVHHGIDPVEARNPRRAILAGYRLRTNYRSVVHEAGAANIEPALGHAVEGVVIEITDSIRQALRRKEGWPVRYREIEVEVKIVDTDEIVDALTYIVTPEYRLPFDLPVTQRYRDLILEGAARFHFRQTYQRRLRRILRPLDAEGLVYHARCRTLDRSEP